VDFQTACHIRPAGQAGTQPGADFGFFARFGAEATRLDPLRPALGQERFFFADDCASMLPAA